MSWPAHSETLDADLAALDEAIRGWGVQHFTAREITHLNSARPGEPAWCVPPVALWPSMRLTLQCADAIRTATRRPVGVVSGYRPGGYNARVGGEPRSYHMQFGALDIRPAGGFATPAEYDAWAQLCEDTAVQFALSMGGGLHTGIGRYPGAGRQWVHVDVGVRLARARWTA